MATDSDIKKDFEECYNGAQSHWSSYWDEAKTDLKFREGDQYKAKDKTYLLRQDREALVFNKCLRITNTICGYEQKNLLSIKIDPMESADEKTASQLSALILNAMWHGGGYMAMSGAFEFGTVTCGMNLVEPWVDRGDDLLNGDIRFRRLPYNRYVLDPTFTDRDLDRDCGFVITRDFFNRGQAASLLPDRAAEISRLRGGFSDSKFSAYYPLKGKGNEYNLKYDRFYVATHRPYRILADVQSGRIIPVPAEKADGDPRTEELIKLFIQRFPQIKVLKGAKKGVDLHIFVEGNLMYSGQDSTGLDEYPFVLEAGYFTPEDDDPKYRMQGVVRAMRDPGTEANRRRSMIIDMLDGVIRSGWKVKEGSVVNEDELYNAGFSVIWMKKGEEMANAERLSPPNIPEGLFRASEMFDKDHDSVAGVNQEMLGDPINENIEVAATLAKLRSSNGLVSLQGLFNNHRFAKVLMGRKLIRVIQQNYTAAKVQRILGEAPTKEFYTRDFGKYDAVPCEGVLTDSQRQMYYAQLAAWKKAGAPIPWASLVEYAPIEKKDDLKKAMAAAEQAQSKALAEDTAIKAATAQLLNAQRFQSIAQGKQKLAQVQSELAGAGLDRAKSAKEIQGLDYDNFMKVLNMMQVMAQFLAGPQDQGEMGQQAGALPNLESMTAVGRA